jgi:hypothetical protein
MHTPWDAADHFSTEGSSEGEDAATTVCACGSPNCDLHLAGWGNIND